MLETPALGLGVHCRVSIKVHSPVCLPFTRGVASEVEDPLVHASYAGVAVEFVFRIAGSVVADGGGASMGS
jgi:hypothetical protein